MFDINNNSAREPPQTKESRWSSQPLTTVSYNTDEYLKTTLQFLIDENIISDYMYINHSGELGSKDHKHLLLIPTKSVDINKLRSTFDEPDSISDIPLGVMPWQTTQPSNFKDWLQYILHDEDYLNQKGLSRVYHYKKQDVITNNAELLERVYTELKQRISEIEVMLGYIQQGFEWYHVAKKLKITTNHMKTFKDTYMMLKSEFANFEDFALDIVNGEGDLQMMQRSVYRSESRYKEELDQLRDDLARAEKIIDTLLNNKTNKQMRIDI